MLSYGKIKSKGFDMKLGDVFKAVIGVALVGLLAKNCTTEVVPSKNADGTETTYSERVGEALVEDVVDFFKGGVRGLTNQTQKILNDNGIDINDYDSLEEFQDAISKKGIELGGGSSNLTDANFDRYAEDPVIDPDVPTTPYNNE